MNVNKQFQIKFDLYIYIYIYASEVLHTLPLCSHIPFSYNHHKELNDDLKGITFVMLAVHEQVSLMSSSQSETRLPLYAHEQFAAMSLHISVYDREREGGGGGGGGRVFTKVKIIFSKRFDACLHQLILFITYLNFTSYSDIYNKIVFITMLQENFIC